MIRKYSLNNTAIQDHLLVCRKCGLKTDAVDDQFYCESCGDAPVTFVALGQTMSREDYPQLYYSLYKGEPDDRL